MTMLKIEVWEVLRGPYCNSNENRLKFIILT